MIRAEYPLRWPAGWPRTTHRRRAPFRACVRSTYQHLLHEIRLMGGSDVTISSNLKARRDGLPLAHQPVPDDPGVALYWRDGHGRQMAVACDRWQRPADNIRAILLSLAALRGLERWGVSTSAGRALSGFAALPSPDDWRAILGLPQDATPGPAEIEAAFRRRARQIHPDAGGDTLAFRRLVEARDRALAEVAR